MKRRFIILTTIIYTIISIILVGNVDRKPNSIKYDVIIILGNSPNYFNKPNVFLKKRLNAGIELLNKGYSEKILLTGAKKESKLSEAEIMKRYCINQGVSPTKIILEYSAKSTKENLIYSNEIINKLGLHKALVITSSHHAKRTNIYCDLMHLKNVEVVSCKNNLLTMLSYIPLMLWESHKTSKIK